MRGGGYRRITFSLYPPSAVRVSHPCRLASPPVCVLSVGPTPETVKRWREAEAFRALSKRERKRRTLAEANVALLETIKAQEERRRRWRGKLRAKFLRVFPPSAPAMPPAPPA
eukprot:GHVU01024275.1.p2 GENE.GHVU01024275.1~~GHVU01024275.1.p2  ORF type:complete len:113 (-),score=9.37 GHVU01024275.1:1124-1462(-)